MMEEKYHSILSSKDLVIGYHKDKEDFLVSRVTDLNIMKGELVGVVGANGAGKSTLLRSISGIQPFLKGTISLNNKPVKQYSAIELARELSVVVTEQPMAKNLTAIELIALGRQPYTDWIGNLSQNDREHLNQVIRQLDLEPLKNKACYEMSDGQLQKVLIARALAQDTSTIILDEPTTHLDIYHKTYILKLLKKIAHEHGKAVIFSTHEIDLAIQLCDKMLIMNNKETYYDEPCRLIEKGLFSRLFPADLIYFDKKSGTFRVRK
ncbi:ABC transporter ATP-binding protein [Robertkochia aurantiaca]|uniref:ABC transporter ATP-binding protein n=1 Tax=Robertkochia aurantiaca TaxID=2873700 RepID=UPI001CD03845|nr:ABC transporter ATP-binding protein [Robertkochia sp. 3YJGBD-33]